MVKAVFRKTSIQTLHDDEEVISTKQTLIWLAKWVHRLNARTELCKQTSSTTSSTWQQTERIGCQEPFETALISPYWCYA